MITMRNYPYLLITLFASFLLSACLQAQPVLAQHSHAGQFSTIHLPIVANGLPFASRQSIESGQSSESIDSYRITHTSIFTHSSSSSPEQVVRVYEWHRAENQYGFNSGSRLDLNGMAMQEVYLIDEAGYGGLFGLVGPGVRAEIDAENPPPGASVIYPLTVTGENDESGFFSTNGRLPVAISEIISQSQVVGTEIINGVSTSHYQLDDVALLTNPVVFGKNATISSAQGDFWIVSSGEHVVKFVVRAKSDTGSTHHLEYSVDKINSHSGIDLPAKYRTEIDALRDGTQLPYPDCDTCLFPIFPNSQWGYNSMTVGNGLIFAFPMGDMTESEMKGLYEERLVALGWAVTKDEEWVASNDTKDFSVRFEQVEDAFRISISFLPKYRTNYSGLANHPGCDACLSDLIAQSSNPVITIDGSGFEIRFTATDLSFEEMRSIYKQSLLELDWQFMEENIVPVIVVHEWIVTDGETIFRLAVVKHGPGEYEIQAEVHTDSR